jgi:nicotinamide-nucleotide amidase
MTMDAQLAALSAQVGQTLEARGLTLATAESCTGGWVAQIITHTAGSSAWFDRGFVTYSNEAKQDMLGVRPETLAREGAVSLETAKEMTAGALKNSKALISLAITGIAGPTGGSPPGSVGGSSGKPVGTVCFSWCFRGEAPVCRRKRFGGDRESVRRQALIFALEELLALIAKKP